VKLLSLCVRGVELDVIPGQTYVGVRSAGSVVFSFSS
jgi:hypothetical protein